jgi:phage gp29-like protein
MAIESRLKEIQDVLNTDLMRQLFELNGWDTEVLPKFEYGDLDEIDIDGFSQAIQRIKATGLIAPTAGNVNYIAEVLGLPDRVADDMSQTALNELLGPPESKSGAGMAKGSGNGTSDSVAARDNSTANKANS